MKHSQNQRILDHLMSGKNISSMLAFKMFGCTRLASRINELRQHHDIKDRWVEHADTRFKLYYIER